MLYDMSEGDKFYGKTIIEYGKRNQGTRNRGGEISRSMGFDQNLAGIGELNKLI